MQLIKHTIQYLIGKLINPTPLLNLNKLSKDLGLKNIFYKDESKRFGLKSFKALGGAYAVEQVSAGKKNVVVATATAGNHFFQISCMGSKKIRNCMQNLHK